MQAKLHFLPRDICTGCVCVVIIERNKRCFLYTRHNLPWQLCSFRPRCFSLLSFFFYKTKLLRRLRICHAIFKNPLFASKGIIHLYPVITGLGHFRCSVRPVYKQKWSEPKLAAILSLITGLGHKKGLKWFILCHTRIHKHSLFPQQSWQPYHLAHYSMS